MVKMRGMTWGEFFAMVRDVLSLGLAGLGAYLAHLAIKMGREQGVIAKRQGEIAETQHQIMLEQLARKANLEIFLVGPSVRDGYDVYPLMAINSGSKPVNSFHYEIWVDDQPFIRVLEGREGKELSGEQYMNIPDGTKESRQHTGMYQLPLFRGTPVQFVTLIIDYTTVPPDMDMHLDVRWVVVSEDGRIEGSPSDILKDIKVEGASVPPEMSGFHIQGSARTKPAQS